MDSEEQYNPDVGKAPKGCKIVFIILVFVFFGSLAGFFLLQLKIRDTGRTHSDELDFDKDIWKKGDIITRGKMINSLVENLRKDKPDYTATIELLGEPEAKGEDYVRYTIDIGSKVMGETWTYNLTIEFENGSFLKCEVYD